MLTESRPGCSVKESQIFPYYQTNKNRTQYTHANNRTCKPEVFHLVKRLSECKNTTQKNYATRLTNIRQETFVLVLNTR